MVSCTVGSPGPATGEPVPSAGISVADPTVSSEGTLPGSDEGFSPFPAPGFPFSSAVLS